MVNQSAPLQIVRIVDPRVRFWNRKKNEHTPFQAENPRTNGWPSFIPMGPITPEFREHLLFLFLLCIQLGLRLLEAFFDIFFLTFQFLGVFP